MRRHPSPSIPRAFTSWLTLLIILLLAACTPAPIAHQQTTPPTPSPSPTLTATPTVTHTPTATPPPQLWVAEYIPEAAQTALEAQLGETVRRATSPETADLRLEIGGEVPAATWVYALAAPFPTIPDGVSGADLQAAWQGRLETGPFAGVPLLMDAATLGVFAQLWGQPSPGVVEVLPAGDLLPTAWARGSAWAILPFEMLNPQWKVLQVDGVSPIQKGGFDPQKYPLSVKFGLDVNLGLALSPITNRNPQQLTDILLTGVTALVRGTALTMEHKGVLYPGEEIAPITTAVDFLHVNNEIPFTPDCPPPRLYSDALIFCSDVRYLELLTSIGTDVVELSGDHFGDHGPEGTLFTLDLYDEAGLSYYGGGRNLEDGRKALLLTHNGNKIAFLGCNAKGVHYYAPADENTPGAVPCDFAWLEAEIRRLKAEGYVVVMTFQHIEYYSYVAQPDLIRDFGRAAAAGADIVSGSQSHQAHGMAFENGAFIHYGLGNLFFDQYLYCKEAACDYGFMDRHVIYAGRHISTELIPIRFIDMARPRLMTPAEKSWFLGIIFRASGWE